MFMMLSFLVASIFFNPFKSGSVCHVPAGTAVIRQDTEASSKSGLPVNSVVRVTGSRCSANGSVLVEVEYDNEIFEVPQSAVLNLSI